MIRNALNAGHQDHEMTRIFLQQLDAAKQHLEMKKNVHTSVDTIIRALERVRKKLDRPLRIAIAGELNAGKTTFSNVLIGNTTLPTRAISNTRIPTLIRYSERPSITALFSNGHSRPIRLYDLEEDSRISRLDVGLPNKLLKCIEILDCPGLSDPQIMPNDFNISLFHIDAAIWCTSGTGPWRKSEEDCWLAFPKRIRKRSLLVVTRKDKLNSINENKILSRLRHEVSGLFNDIVLLSSTYALKAYEIERNPQEMWNMSGAEDLDIKLSRLISNIQAQRFDAAKLVTDRITQHFLKLL